MCIKHSNQRVELALLLFYKLIVNLISRILFKERFPSVFTQLYVVPKFVDEVEKHNIDSDQILYESFLFLITN